MGWEVGEMRVDKVRKPWGNGWRVIWGNEGWESKVRENEGKFVERK